MASGDLERWAAMMRAQNGLPTVQPVYIPQVLQPAIDHGPLPDDIEARFVANDKDHQALLTIIDQLVTKLADVTERLEIAEDKIAAFEMGVRDTTRAA
jgi:hypothetical protein